MTEKKSSKKKVSKVSLVDYLVEAITNLGGYILVNDGAVVLFLIGRDYKKETKFVANIFNPATKVEELKVSEAYLLHGGQINEVDKRLIDTNIYCVDYNLYELEIRREMINKFIIDVINKNFV